MSEWRYLIPNAFTATSLLFGFVSVIASIRGDIFSAAWFGLWCVLTDKLDGFSARALRASSPFGVQFDSFADFMGFGVAPATLFVATLVRIPSLGFDHGFGHVALLSSAGLYLLAVGVRLARFNVLATEGDSRFFFGIPTTLTGGTLMALFLTLLKYGDPQLIGDLEFTDPHLLGHVQFSHTALQLFPAWLLLGGIGMLSSLRVPKLGLTRNRWANLFIAANIVGVYGFGLMRWMPEYLAGVGLVYVGVSVIYGKVSEAARTATRPPLFAMTQGAAGAEEDEAEPFAST